MREVSREVEFDGATITVRLYLNKWESISRWRPEFPAECRFLSVTRTGVDILPQLPQSKLVEIRESLMTGVRMDKYERKLLNHSTKVSHNYENRSKQPPSKYQPVW